jgi:hypothetical protein
MSSDFIGCNEQGPVKKLWIRWLVEWTRTTDPRPLLLRELLNYTHFCYSEATAIHTDQMNGNYWTTPTFVIVKLLQFTLIEWMGTTELHLLL